MINSVVLMLCFCISTTEERLYQQYFGFKGLRELLVMTPSQQSRHVVQVSILFRQTGAYKSQIVPRKMQKVPIDLKTDYKCKYYFSVQCYIYNVFVK